MAEKKITETAVEEKIVEVKEKVSPATIARTICLVLALANQILAYLGKGTIDIADETVYQVCTIMATLITAGVAAWKNNSFTKAAIKADAKMKTEKLAKKYGLDNYEYDGLGKEVE